MVTIDDRIKTRIITTIITKIRDKEVKDKKVRIIKKKQHNNKNIKFKSMMGRKEARKSLSKRV